jgi:chromosome segregation ATPase
LRQDVAERDHEIARLRGDVDRLGQARSDAVSRERTVQERLKERIEDLTALSRRIEAQRRELAVQQSQSQALREAADQGLVPRTRR